MIFREREREKRRSLINHFVLKEQFNHETETER